MTPFETEVLSNLSLIDTGVWFVVGILLVIAVGRKRQ